ncbi:MAG: glycoside hydrolase family 65 protein [Clostridia bacterium]|nr:glycoside hydrolase family 65 protein [Clostridia bacterium]
MRKIHRTIPVLFKPRGWIVEETEYSESTNKLNETIFTAANGYLGVRGFFEEGFYGSPSESDPSVMINGIYEYYPYRHIWRRPGFPERFHSIINNVNPIEIFVYVNGEKVSLGGNVSGYSRALDMKRGVVTRSFDYTTHSGEVCSLKYTRCASQTEKHLLLTRVEIEAPAGAEVEIRTLLRPIGGMSASKKEEIGSDMPYPVTLDYVKSYGDEGVIDYSTKESKFGIACAVSENCSIAAKTIENGDNEFSTRYKEVSSGKRIVYDRFSVFVTSRDRSDYAAKALQIARESKKAGFADLLKKSESYWFEYWDTSDIQIDDDVLINQGIRFGLYMINQSAGKDGKTNISANGLTGTAYSGHTFWDTEIFMTPMFLYSHPEIVRQLLIYRYNILPKAKERAMQMDDVGALYSWNSINGEECGHVFEAATAQYHINNDVFYAIFKYYEATEDWDFMEKYGIEILAETSKCLSYRGNFIERRGGKFCINCVCGPDEYNPVVDNNLYTNFLTKKQFEFTLEMLAELKRKNPVKHAELMEKCELDDADTERMKAAAENMYLPFDEENGIYMQDDNFIYKDPIDVDKIPLEKLPLLTHLHPLNLWRYQVCKQADIVLLMFLESHEFSPQMRKKVFDFYEPRTIHDSSLSAGIHSIVACDIGYEDEAYGYLKQACRMDLDNVNRNTYFGIHAACMGSCWMMIVNGYAGMRVYDGKLHFKPFIPKKWSGYAFKIKFRGSLISVRIGKDETEYKLLDGEGSTFFDGNDEITLNESNKSKIIRRTTNEKDREKN